MRAFWNHIGPGTLRVGIVREILCSSEQEDGSNDNDCSDTGAREEGEIIDPCEREEGEIIDDNMHCGKGEMC